MLVGVVRLQIQITEREKIESKRGKRRAEGKTREPTKVRGQATLFGSCGSECVHGKFAGKCCGCGVRVCVARGERIRVNKATRRRAWGEDDRKKRRKE